MTEESERGDTQEVAILPTAPYALGAGPTDVEYEFTSDQGTHEHTVAPLGAAVKLPVGKIRYRFLWNGRPGAWNNEGVAWRPPA